MKVGYEKLWQWFGSSRASFAVIPRALMHEMPDDWQSNMADLLEEYSDTFDTSDVCSSISVTAKTNGRFSRLPEWITNYRRPLKKVIEAHRVNGGGA